VAKETADPSASVGMTKGRIALPVRCGLATEKQQIW
jgi:hypothetical protein